MRLSNIALFKPDGDHRQWCWIKSWCSIPHPTLPLIVTASNDKKARVYSLQDFTLHSTLEKGHKRSIRSVAWKPNVKKGELSIVTGSFDATAGFWRRGEQEDQGEERYTEIDFTTGGGDNLDEEEHDWEFTLVLEGHDSEIKCVAFSPSGQFLATCSRDKTVWIWEEVGEDGEDEWETVALLKDHDGDVKHLAWVEMDGEERLASCSFDETIRIYRNDGEDWEAVAVLNGHSSTVLGIDWENSETNPILLSGSTLKNDADRRPGDVQESTLLNPKPTPRIVSCSADETIKIWSCQESSATSHFASKDRIPSTFQRASSGETWECTATLPKVHNGAIYSVSWSKKSGRIVSTGNDSQVVVYEERLVQKNGGVGEDHSAAGEVEEKGAEEKAAAENVVEEKAAEEAAGGAEGAESKAGRENEDKAAEATAGGAKDVESKSDGENVVLAEEEGEMQTEWVVVAIKPIAHNTWEVNHAIWCGRFDGGRKGEEEMIVTTGDDGEVNAWALVDGDYEVELREAEIEGTYATSLPDVETEDPTPEEAKEIPDKETIRRIFAEAKVERKKNEEKKNEEWLKKNGGKLPPKRWRDIWDPEGTKTLKDLCEYMESDVVPENELVREYKEGYRLRNMNSIALAIRNLDWDH